MELSIIPFIPAIIFGTICLIVKMSSGGRRTTSNDRSATHPLPHAGNGNVRKTAPPSRSSPKIIPGTYDDSPGD